MTTTNTRDWRASLLHFHPEIRNPPISHLDERWRAVVDEVALRQKLLCENRGVTASSVADGPYTKGRRPRKRVRIWVSGNLVSRALG